MMKVLILPAIIYVAFRIFKILPVKRWLKIAILSVYGLGAVAFALTITGMIDHLPMSLAAATYVFGNSWLIFLLYSCLLFLLMDVLRLMRILPGKLLQSSIVGSVLVFGIVAGLMVYGGIHYHHKYREEMTIASAKIAEPVKIVLVSDLHAGYHNRHREIGRWVNMINAEQPDLVLMAGDLIDRSMRAVRYDHDASRLLKIQAPVYACLGNHEYYAGVDDAITFYKEADITLLRDSVAHACGITIVGRDDAKNEDRRKLVNIMKAADRKSFILLLDHKPIDLLEAQLAGVDFQFSGHTHSGQVWPISIIARVENELSHGHLKKGDTQYYVTSGLGIWGGKFRIGTRSEYLVLNLVPEVSASTPQN